jgi:hypothetical protein
MRLIFHKPPEAQEMNDFFIGCIVEKAAGSPITVQSPHRPATFKDVPELRFVQIVIPNVREVFQIFHTFANYTLANSKLLCLHTNTGREPSYWNFLSLYLFSVER